MPADKLVKTGQTLIDIAMQYGGTAENLFLVAAANGKSITDQITPGQLIDGGMISVSAVNEVFNKYGLYPASGGDTLSILAPQGIDFWAIEQDFIIS